MKHFSQEMQLSPLQQRFQKPPKSPVGLVVSPPASPPASAVVVAVVVAVRFGAVPLSIP